MWRNLWLWAIGALLAMAVGITLVLAGAPPTLEVPSVPGPTAQAPARPPALPPAQLQPAAPTPPVQASLPKPPGVSAEEWDVLKNELSGRPQELRRLAGYYAFADALERYRSGHGNQSAAARQALARTLDASLDERLRQRELNIGEARMIKAAVLQELLADDAQRAAAMTRWQAEQLAANPAETAHLRPERDFLQRQAAIVSAWQARPAAQRDPQALERELDALRRSAWPSPTGTQKETSR
jgi:hypothetical protein